MTAQTSSAIHRILTWIAGIGTGLTLAIMVSVSGAFVDMRDTLIRMEKIPGTVDQHEHRIDVHDREIQTLQNKP